MEIRIIENNFSQKEYNSVATHPLQSWEWGEARKAMGVQVLRLGVFEEKTLTEVYQITFHPLPYLPYTVAYLPKSVIPSKKVLEFIAQVSKKYNAIFVKCEPNAEQQRIAQIPAVLKKSSHPLFPEWTQVLDLTLSEEELFKNLKQKTRYNIRVAEKNDVQIKELTNGEGYAMFEKLFFATTKRQSYHGHNPQYHKTVFNFLKATQSHILIALYKGIPLSAYHLFYFNDVLYYPYGGSSEEYKNVMASNLLMWEAIRLGKKLGAKKFDMWGSLPAGYSQSDAWSGFTRFKEGYNTQFVQFVGSYDFVLNLSLYWLYTIAYNIRKLVL